MDRRDLLKAFLAMPLAAAELYAQRTRGLPPLLIKEVQVIPTSPGGPYGWVFIKIITSEPGLFGIGSASNAFQTFAVVESIRTTKSEKIKCKVYAAREHDNSAYQDDVLCGLFTIEGM